MYEYSETMGDQIIRLENENLNLRRQLGEFGFFGGQYAAPNVTDIRNNLKKKLTVREWELINNLSISNSPEEIKECAELLLKLVDEGAFTLPQISYPYSNPYVNPYYNIGGNMYSYPPMGAGVVADPKITEALKPKPIIGSKQISISDDTMSLMIPSLMYPWIHFDPETKSAVIDVENVDENKIIDTLHEIKVKIMEAINHNRVITIWIPQEFIEFAHETFKGHIDYIGSAVIVTCPKMITIISADLVYKLPIVNCIMTIFAKIFGKTVEEINDEYADLIGSTDESEYEEGDNSNNESD